MTTKNSSPKYYVAIGASAGGLEALQSFFQGIKRNHEVAFIVVQHLAPDFKSVMVELLDKVTSLNVVSATDGCEVVGNTIYFIPPGKNLMIGEGRLLLSDQYPDRTPNFPIDIFFRSLAEDAQHRSIAIVLSGTGSDGSRGILATKEVGGLVMVQDSDSAKFDGMPLSAVQTGCADFIASPEQLAEKLQSYLTHPLIANAENKPPIIEEEAVLKEIYKLLEKEYEIDFSLYKPQTVTRRIERRMGLNQTTDIREYLRTLIQNSEELQLLSKDMLIGVTRFFRDGKAFEELENKVIPDIINNLAENETVRVWSAGCSTGEEAISIAILLDEYMQKSESYVDVKVFATDVDPETIALASQAKFAPNIVDDLGKDRFNRYFTQEGDYYVLIPRIRKMVIFAVHNLLTDPPFSNIHLAICRNVLIYFQPDTQKRVLLMLTFALRMGGYLFLGPSEVNTAVAKLMDIVNERQRIYRKVSSQTKLIGETNHQVKDFSEKKKSPSVDSILKSYEKNNAAAYNVLLEKILEDYLPPSVLMDSDKNILHFYGDINQFTLRPTRGRVSNAILDVMIEPLTIPVSSALQQADRSDEDVVLKEVPVTLSNDNHCMCEVSVKRLRSSNSNSSYYLLCIQKERAISIDDENYSAIKFNVDEAANERIKELEAELKYSEERLQLSIEELETTNEELQSSNEELLAANEELQSTNEELQSVNEELYTVNSEYQVKIEEVTASNSDLDTLINNMDVGIVFLDDQMLIRKYSPAANRHFNLLASDVGRPFHHISHNLDFPSLLNELANVFKDGAKFEKIVLNNQTNKRVLIRINSSRNGDLSGDNNCILSLTELDDELH